MEAKELKGKKNKFIKLTDRYGVWGLGLLTTGLLGPFTSLLLGLILIKDTRRFLTYLLVGIFVWSFILAYLFTPLIDIISV
jgi:hypothetical protein